MARPPGRARWSALPALALCAAAGAMSGCLLQGYEYESTSGTDGTGGNGGASTTTETGAGGTGGTTTGQGGSGGSGATTSMSTGGTDTGGTGGTGGKPHWAATYGGLDETHAYAVAVGPNDGIAVGGSLRSTVSFGVSSLLCTGATDGYVLHSTSAGVPDLAIAFSGDAAGAADQSIRAVALVPDGVIVAGQFVGQVTFPQAGITLLGSGMTDVFVAKLDPSGVYKWSAKLAGTQEDTVSAIAVDPEGNVIVVGGFQKVADFGDVPLTVESGTGPDAYVVKLAGASGVTLWAKMLGGPNNDVATGVAVDYAGNVTAVGYYQTSIGFEANSAIQNGGSDDAFALRLDKKGTYGWLRGFGDGGSQIALGAAATPDGSVYIAGNLSGGTLTLGGTTLMDAIGSATDIFVAKLEPNSGDPTWSMALENANLVSQMGLIASPGGGFALAGNFSGTASFGGMQAVSNEMDAFVLRFGVGEGYLWHAILTGAGAQAANAVAFDSLGAVVVAGDFSGPTNFGKGEVSPTVAGKSDAFVMKIPPLGL